MDAFPDDNETTLEGILQRMGALTALPPEWLPLVAGIQITKYSGSLPWVMDIQFSNGPHGLRLHYSSTRGWVETMETEDGADSVDRPIVV